MAPQQYRGPSALAFLTAALAFVLLDIGPRGGLGTRAEEFPDVTQPYQFLAQQPSQVSQQQLESLLSQPQAAQQQAGLQALLSEPSQLPAFDQQQANLGSLLGSSAQFSPQPSQQFLQAQLPQQASQQFLQPQPQQQASMGMDTSAGLGFFQTQQAPSFSQYSQAQNMMANVPMKEVADLMHSVETLQKELSTSRMHEKQLNDMAYNAAQRSESIDQSARKLASLAQASVSQVTSMKAHVKEVETEKDELSKEKDELFKEKDELQTQLSEARTTVKRIQDREAAENSQVLEFNDAYKRHELALAQQQQQHQLRSLRSQQLQQRPYEPNRDDNLDQFDIAKASPQAQAKALAQAQALAQTSPESFAQLYNTARLRAAPSSSSYQPNIQEALPDSSQALIERLRSGSGMQGSALPDSSQALIERLRSDSGTYGAYNSRAASEAVDRQPGMSFLNNRR